MLEEGRNEFKEEKFSRELREFFDDNNSMNMYWVHLIKIPSSSISPLMKYSLTSTLLALYRVSINDKTRLRIYDDLKIKEPLKMILSKGKPIEIKYTLRLIAQLTFNEKIKKDLILDKEFMSLLEKVKEEDEKTDEHLLKSNCEQIEWNLKGKKKQKMKSMTILDSST